MMHAPDSQGPGQRPDWVTLHYTGLFQRVLEGHKTSLNGGGRAAAKRVWNVGCTRLSQTAISDWIGDIATAGKTLAGLFGFTAGKIGY